MMKRLIFKNIPYGTLVIAILLGIGISQVDDRPQWVIPLYIGLAIFGLVVGTLRNLSVSATKNDEESRQ